MESRGGNNPENVIAVIPARYDSTRLPGKLLLPVAGRPLVLHTMERAQAASTVRRVIVATDSAEIRDTVIEAGGEAIMTSAEHISGSDRIAEAARSLPEDSIIVNVQGDEPLISPKTIDAAVNTMLADDVPDIVTTFEAIENRSELFDPNIVKVVVGEAGYAIYFSRSPIPFPREAALSNGGDAVCAVEKDPDLLRIFKKHAGLYVYRRQYLLKFTRLPRSRLERIEMLEQLRALENGAKIKMVGSVSRSVGVDTADDLEKVRAILEDGLEKCQ